MSNIASLVAAGGVLKLGQSGMSVQALQLALAKRGYPLTGTGYFGNATDAAVEAFQRMVGLSVTGDVDAATAKEIDALPLPAPSTAIGRPLWLDVAMGLLGTKEGVGVKDNPDIIEWAHELGGDIAKSYTHDSIPWCALFVGHCLATAGEKGTGTLWALDYASWGVRLAGPAIGAIASMQRTGGGHVCIVLGRDHAGNVVCIGGNQSDMVCIRSFPVARIKAFTWPVGPAIPIKVGMPNLPFVNSAGVSTSEA